MMSATYTDPTTGWSQRVEVLGDAPAEPGTADQWVWIRNTEDAQAKVPSTTLKEFYRLQGENREYLPGTKVAGA